MKREPLKYISAPRIRCPRCGSPELRATHSDKHDDGTIFRRTRCKVCGHRFGIILE